MKTPIIRLVAYVAKTARVKEWLPRSFTNTVRKAVLMRSVAQYPDRRHLEDVILPALAARDYKKVLFVGCEPYTQWYEKLFKGSEYWTTDIKEESAAWGAKNHVVADITRIDEYFDHNTFDLVILNGVYGWGVNTTQSMSSGFDAVMSILKPNGDLMLGWNPQLVESDALNLAIERGFQMVTDLGVEPLMNVGEMKHCFATFRKSIAVTAEPAPGSLVANYS